MTEEQIKHLAANKIDKYILGQNGLFIRSVIEEIQDALVEMYKEGQKEMATEAPDGYVNILVTKEMAEWINQNIKGGNP